MQISKPAGTFVHGKSGSIEEKRSEVKKRKEKNKWKDRGRARPLGWSGRHASPFWVKLTVLVSTGFYWIRLKRELAHARSKVEALQYSCQYTSINSSAHPLSSISLSFCPSGSGVAGEQALNSPISQVQQKKIHAPLPRPSFWYSQELFALTPPARAINSTTQLHSKTNKHSSFHLYGIIFVVDLE